MSDRMTRCINCGKWTNYGVTCMSCSPDPLEDHSQEKSNDVSDDDYESGLGEESDND